MACPGYRGRKLLDAIIDKKQQDHEAEKWYPSSNVTPVADEYTSDDLSEDSDDSRDKDYIPEIPKKKKKYDWTWKKSRPCKQNRSEKDKDSWIINKYFEDQKRYPSSNIIPVVDEDTSGHNFEDFDDSRDKNYIPEIPTEKKKYDWKSMKSRLYKQNRSEKDKDLMIIEKDVEVEKRYPTSNITTVVDEQTHDDFIEDSDYSRDKDYITEIHKNKKNYDFKSMKSRTYKQNRSQKDKKSMIIDKYLVHRKELIIQETTDEEDSLIDNMEEHALSKEKYGILEEEQGEIINTEQHDMSTDILLTLENVTTTRNIIEQEVDSQPVDVKRTEENTVTKTGKPRKRKRFTKSLHERKEEKIQTQFEKLSLKEPCNLFCKKKCTSKFTEEQRKMIHDIYVNLNWVARGMFIKGFVTPQSITRRKQTDKAVPKRNISYKYYLKAESSNEEKTEVCKTFFLTTLGYNAKNDRRVLHALKQSIVKQKDLRGSYERKNKIDRNILKDHILCYNPTISHYRRENTPKKLYLPSDITTTSMYNNFCENNPDFKVSFEIYRRVVKEDLNISFAHHEECEQCAHYKHHNNSHLSIQDDSCEVCQNYSEHKERYITTRAEYIKDQATTEQSLNYAAATIYYSVDLQKVVMLPRIEQYKAAIFCPRIIAFNESFVPVGRTTKYEEPFAAIWNETISGRLKEDIISTFRAFFYHKRDVQHIVLWLDNGAAQNKNWSLLSYLVNIINSNLISTNSITLKYFEPCHSFMSADHFHHQVEKSLQKTEVYDFEDFQGCVKQANSKKNTVKVMAVSDFYLFVDHSSQHKLKTSNPQICLKNIIVLKVERGNFLLQFKRKYNEEYESLDFLKKNIIKTQIFPDILQKKTPRGITKDRKREIVEKLVKFMPENRRRFWCDLPEIEGVPNVTQED